jgi:hypothetical protein
MALFSKAPEKSLIKDRDAALANRDRLAAKLVEAEQAIFSAKTVSQAAALSGDDASLDKLEASERAAQHRHGTLSAASAEAGAMLAFLDESIATVTDQRVRAATSVATLALADELVEVAAAYDASTRALNECATRALAVSFELNGLVVFTASSVIEVAAAIPVVTEVLRQHSRAVLNNLAPAAMPLVPEPPAKPPLPAPAKAPTVRVFSTRPVKWLDEDGKQVSGGKCVDLDLPVAVAERALASGACVKLDNLLRAGNLGRWPGNYSLNVCVDLDAADASAPQLDPVLHTAFTPIDRGKPFTLRIAGAGQ